MCPRLPVGSAHIADRVLDAAWTISPCSRRWRVLFTPLRDAPRSSSSSLRSATFIASNATREADMASAAKSSSLRYMPLSTGPPESATCSDSW